MMALRRMLRAFTLWMFFLMCCLYILIFLKKVYLSMKNLVGKMWGA